MFKFFLRENLVTMIIAAVFSVLLFFFSLMTVFRYSCDMEEDYISGCSEEILVEFTNGLTNGKTIDNYYGIKGLLDKATELTGGQNIIIVRNSDEKPVTSNQQENSFEISSFMYKQVRQAILDGDGKVCGYLDSYYPISMIFSAMKSKIISSAVGSLLILAVTILIFSVILIRALMSRNKALLVIIGGMILMGLFCTWNYSSIFIESAEKNISGTADYISGSIQELSEKGIRINDISDLDEYLESEAGKYEWVSDIYLDDGMDSSETTEDKMADIRKYRFQTDDKQLVICYRIADNYIIIRVLKMLLAFFATVILAVICMIESLPVADLMIFRKTKIFNSRSSTQYEFSAVTLRLTNFLTSTCSYMCMSFSALQIKEWNQGFWGISPIVASALSVSLCTLAEAAGMIIVPLTCGRIKRKHLMIISSFLLMSSNIACFFTGSTLMMVGMRIISGFGFAGNKQVNNQFITMCYETEEERQKNLSESNAGIIGGILCGMGMGSVIAGIFGYGATFLCAGLGFVLYMAANLRFTPWKLLDTGEAVSGADTLKSLKEMGRVLVSPGVWKMVLLVAAPQYLFLMVIITLIPGRIQSADYPGDLLTYCNLLNGIFGLYAGAAIGRFLVKRLGRVKTLALIFAGGTASIFIIQLPFTMLMLLISAVIAGILDGAGTPLATDLFLDSPELTSRLDEATGLMYYSIVGFVVMSVAPVLLELCEKNSTVMAVTCGVLLAVTLLVMTVKDPKKSVGNADQDE